MKIPRFVYALSAVNFLLLLFLLAQMRPVVASTESPVLRGRALEIVDDQGRVRASIKLHPADATVRLPDGTTGYPEVVVLRLIDQNGRPGLKAEASVRGGGIGLIGQEDTHAVLGTSGTQSKLRLKDKGGQEMVIKPAP